MNNYLEYLEDQLPQFLKPQDLVDLGLWPNIAAVYVARSKGMTPCCVRIGRKILFPRKGIVDFLNRRTESEVQRV